MIAQTTVTAFVAQHPETKSSLERWAKTIKTGSWKTTADVQATFPKAKVLNAERIRFEVSGGDYRLIASFKFKNQIVFVKFIGTHAEYDRIDALTVSLF